MKIKLFEKSNNHIRYEVWEGKNKINSGWYKFNHTHTKGQIANEIMKMYLGGK